MHTRIIFGIAFSLIRIRRKEEQGGAMSLLCCCTQESFPQNFRCFCGQAARRCDVYALRNYADAPDQHLVLSLGSGSFWLRLTQSRDDKQTRRDSFCSILARLKGSERFCTRRFLGMNCSWLQPTESRNQKPKRGEGF